MIQKKLRFVLWALLILVLLIALAWWHHENKVSVSSDKPKNKPLVAAPIIPGAPDKVKISTLAQGEENNKIGDGELAAEMAASLSAKNMLFSENSFALRLSVQNALNLRPDQALLLEEITKTAAYEVASELVKNAQLVKTPQGEVYFSIKKLGASNHFKKEFASKIESAVGGSKGKMIAALAGNTSIFSQFGEKDVEVYISDETDPDGGTQTYVTTEIVEDAGNKDKRTKFYTNVTDQMKNPIYDLLIQKFHNDLK